MFPSARGLEWLKNKRIGLGKYFSFYGCLNTLKGKGVVSGSFTINLYISPLRIGMFNVHVPLMGYIVCLMMYGDDIEWREYPHCCSQIPERALTKFPVDLIIVSAQIWFEMNVEFVWSNSKMFLLFVWNILPTVPVTDQTICNQRQTTNPPDFGKYANNRSELTLNILTSSSLIF